MRAFPQEITNKQDIKNDKTLKAAYAKRGKMGFYRVELFRVGDHYKIVKFNLFDSFINFFRSLCAKTKNVHFEALAKKKWKGQDVSWVRDLGPKQEKTDKVAQDKLKTSQTSKPKSVDVTATLKKFESCAIKLQGPNLEKTPTTGFGSFI